LLCSVTVLLVQLLYCCAQLLYCCVQLLYCCVQLLYCCAQLLYCCVHLLYCCVQLRDYSISMKDILKMAVDSRQKRGLYYTKLSRTMDIDQCTNSVTFHPSLQTSQNLFFYLSLALRPN